MGSKGMFNGPISILEKSLDLRSLRQNLIVSNIANKDTPHYKAFDLAVEEELEKLSDTGASVVLRKTHPAHFPASDVNKDYSEIRLSSASDEFEQSSDGNTVDIEAEMVKLAENNLQFETMAQLIRQKFQGLKLVIQGGK